MTDHWLLPPARNALLAWHAGLLAASVAVPFLFAAWYAQRQSQPPMTRTDANIGVIRGKTPAQTAHRIFLVALLFIGAEAVFDAWFFSQDLARQAHRPGPELAGVVGPTARLALGFLGGLALVSGPRRLDLQDPHTSTLFLFRLAGAAILIAVTAWSRASVAELMLQLAVVLFAAHWLRAFFAEIAPSPARQPPPSAPRSRGLAWQTLGMLVVSAALFWAVTKFGRAGNLYAYELARGHTPRAMDVLFQMRAR